MNAADNFERWMPVVIRIADEMPEEVVGTHFNVFAWLEDQLGTTMYREYFPRNRDLDFPMSAEWVEVFKKLDSPHWRTILKAFRIQKGLEHA